MPPPPSAAHFPLTAPAEPSQASLGSGVHSQKGKPGTCILGPEQAVQRQKNQETNKEQRSFQSSDKCQQERKQGDGQEAMSAGGGPTHVSKMQCEL